MSHTIIWSDSDATGSVKWFAAVHTPLLNQVSPVPRAMLSREIAARSCGNPGVLTELPCLTESSPDLVRRCHSLTEEILESSRNSMASLDTQIHDLEFQVDQKKTRIDRMESDIKDLEPHEKGNLRRKINAAKTEMAALSKQEKTLRRILAEDTPTPDLVAA